MNVNDLPKEITTFFSEIPNWQKNIGDDVVPILLKLWWEKTLTPAELDEIIAPDEVAAIWSVLHKRAIKPRTVREKKRQGHIHEKKSASSGRLLLYTVGEIKDVSIVEKPVRTKPPKYPSWTNEHQREYKKQQRQSLKEKEEKGPDAA